MTLVPLNSSRRNRAWGSVRDGRAVDVQQAETVDALADNGWVGFSGPGPLTAAEQGLGVGEGIAHRGGGVLPGGDGHNLPHRAPGQGGEDGETALLRTYGRDWYIRDDALHYKFDLKLWMSRGGPGCPGTPGRLPRS